MADNNASTQANRLWPYLRPKVERVSRVANGSGGGNAVSGGRLATLQDVNLVAPSDGQVLTYDAATSMWRNEDATGGGGGGGPTYTAGNGIAILSDVISTKQQAAGGITVDTNGLFIRKPSNSGLVVDATGLYVGAGTGIDILGGVTSVNMSDLVDTTQGLGVNSNKATMRLQTGGGLEFNPTDGSVRVDEDAAFQWTGTHQFDAQIQMHAGINFIAADRTITSSSGIDVTWDLGGDLMLAAPKRFRSADFADTIPIAGFSLFNNSGGDRQLTINTIKSDSLHTRLFVADGVRIDLGEEYWGKSLGIVHDDFTSPASLAATVLVYFEDSPAISGALFAVGDWLLIRYLNEGDDFAYGSVWGQVSAYVSMGPDADGRGYQRWTFTMRHGDLGVLVKKGNIAIDFGSSGQGYVHLSTLQSADGPWFRIGDWSGANPYTPSNTHIRTQIGLLDGIGDAALNPSGWGLYSDNAYLHGQLRTAETIMDDDGLALQYGLGTPEEMIGTHSLIAWWDDLGARTGDPEAQISAGKGGAPGSYQDHMSMRIWKSDDSNSSFLTLRAIDPTDGPTYYGASLYLNSSHGAEMWARNTWFYGNALPGEDMTRNLGSASYRWATVYADQIIISGAVSGDSIDGQTWEYPGSMVIDAHTTGGTTVSVTNSGGGTASLDVEGNITLGGTIDGVDISAHVANPNAHHAIATAGGGISVVGQVISIANSAAGAGLTATSGVLAVGAGTGIVVSADSIAIDPAFALPTTATLTTTPPLSGGGLLSADLTLSLTLAPTGGLSPTGGLGLAPGVAGNGLTLTAGIIDVVVGAGLLSAANLVSLDPLLAGNGLTLTTGVLAVGAGDGLVANANTMALDPLVGGAGLTYTAGVLAVGAAAGIQVNANSVQIALASPSGLNTTSGLAVDTSLAGAGLLLTAGVLDVRVSNGLEIISDLVRVNQAYAFSWTGNHTWSTGVVRFNSDPQVNANLDFIGGSRTISGSAGLTLQPATNLTLDPSGGIVYLPDDVEERSATFADLTTGINGFRLWTTSGTARQLVIGSIKTDNLTAKAFTTDLTRLEQGDSFWGKGYGTVETAFDLPAVNANVNVWFDNVPNFAGNIFTVGDKLQCRIVQWTTGISLKLIWFNVEAWVSNDAANFRQQWTLKRLSGGATGDSVGKGNVMEDAGAIGQGWIHVTSMAGGPYMEFGTQTSVSAGVPQFTQYVRIGQLSGTVDYASTAWGFAAGKNLANTPADSANPFSGLTMDSSAGMRLFNTSLNLYNVGNAILSIDKTNGISFEHGTGAFNTIGWYEDLGVPPASPLGSQLLGSVGVARAIAGYTELDLYGIGIAGSYANGVVRLRAATSGGGFYNVWLDNSGTYFGSGSLGTPRSQTGGFISDSIQYLSGDVGIGTATPSERLHLYQNINASMRMRIENPNAGAASQVGIDLKNDLGHPLQLFVTSSNFIASGLITPDLAYLQSNGTDLLFRVISAHDMVFGTTSTERMRILSGGNVGIGVSNPGSSLDLGAGDLGFLSNAGGNNTIQGNQSSDWLFRSRFDRLLFQGGFNDANRRRMRFRLGDTLYAMVIETNGRIGVGADFTATHPLHVYNNDALIANAGLMIQQAGAGDARLQFTQQSTNWTIGIDGSIGDSFAISPSTDLSTATGITIETTGWMGINNTNPGTLLHIGASSPTFQTQAGLWVVPGTAGAGMHVRDTGAVEGGVIASGANIVYVGAWSNHPLVLRSNNVDRITIAAAGAVTVTPALTVTGLITANSGINLGATTLSDYDTAAWTPALLINNSATGIGYNTRRGTWTRVGNMITVWAYIQLSGKGSTTGSVTVTGLPTASNVNNAGRTSCYFTLLASTVASVLVYIIPNTSTIAFYYEAAAGGNPAVLTNTELTNTSIIDFTFSYFV